jgi:hypothetical protein
MYALPVKRMLCGRPKGALKGRYMWIMKQISGIALTMILFISCSTPPKFIFEALANTNFNESLSENEISRVKKQNVYPFTINYKNHYGCPIIKVKIDNKILTFLVDTGSERTWLYNSGIKKMYGSVAELEDNNLNSYIEYVKKTNPEKIQNKSAKQIKNILHKDLIGFKIVFTVNHPFASFMYWPKEDNIDGIIGQDFMKKYKTVTFDFINNLLVFDGDKIKGSVLPFIKTDMEDVFIEFLYNDNKEYGFLDTGNYTFSPRSNFGKDVPSYDFKRSDDYLITYNGKLEKKIPLILTFNNIHIGNIEYNNIKGVYSNIWFSTYNKGAQNMLRFVNGIGCEFFRNHIIQFDYENSNFIIL